MPPDPEDQAEETLPFGSGNTTRRFDEPTPLPVTFWDDLRIADLDRPALELQDLNAERPLRDASRLDLGGHALPSLAGIPLLAKLGQGGMATVYYGVHLRLHKEVAVKILSADAAEREPKMVSRFFREARIAARIQSPHLVSVLDVNEENGLYFLVQEYVDGISAGELLRKRRNETGRGLEETHALEICLAATKGLCTAHAADVIHRDIKPDNILIPKGSTNGSYLFESAKLADLGLARWERVPQSATDLASALGTPGYLPPEQATGAASVAKAADIFGMGATLYALLAGRPPFSGDTAVITIMRTLDKPHEPITKHRSDLTAATQETIERCLAKDPEQRDQNAEELQLRLEWCLTQARAVTSGGQEVVPPPLPTETDESTSGQDGESSQTGSQTASSPQGRPQGPDATDLFTVDRAGDRSSSARRGGGWLVVAAIFLVLGGVAFAATRWFPGLVGLQTNDATAHQDAPDFESALRIADEAGRRGDWQTMADVIERALASSEAASHPGRTQAEEMLRRAQSELRAAATKGSVGGADDLARVTARLRATLATARTDPYGVFAGLDPDQTKHIEADLAKGLALCPTDEKLLALRARLPGIDHARVLAEALKAARTPGEQDPRVADLLELSGKTQATLGQHQKALGFYKEGLSLIEESHGASDKRVASILLLMAEAHVLAGKPEQAKAPLSRAMDIMKGPLETGHMDVVPYLKTKAAMEAGLGEQDAAILTLRRGLDIRQKKAGWDDPESGSIRMQIAGILVKQKRFADAIREIDPAIKAFEPKFGPDSSEVGEALRQKSVALLADNQHALALEPLQRCLPILEKKWGRNSSELSSLHADLAIVFARIGRHQDAEQHFQLALALYGSALGKDHPKIAALLTEYANMLKRIGRKREAEQHERRAEQIRKKLSDQP